MRRQTALAFVAGAGSAAAVALLVGAEAGPAAAPAVPPGAAPSAVGRYQIAHDDDKFVWLVDTTTGHVWCVPDHQGSTSWIDCGSPPDGK